MNTRRAALLAVVGIALAAPAALAEDRTTFFAWGSALEGEATVGANSADFGMSLEEVVDVLDGTFALRHESSGGSFGWYGEFIFNDLKRTGGSPGGTVQANLEQTIVELGLTKPIGDAWDVYGGLRSEQVDMSLDPALLPTASGGLDWVDAVVGLRWRTTASGSRWWARGDLAGGGSDGAWSAELGGAFEFGGSWEFSFAYRALDSSLDDGAVAIDLLQSGVIIGVGKTW